MDRVTRCAQILWSATRNWAPTTGEEVRLAEARLELAKLIYKLDGAGFPQPLVPEATQRRSPEWSAVVDAATNALDTTGTPHPPLGTHAVLWPADKARAADSLPAQSPALPVAWAYSRDPTSEIVARYGPFIDRAAANQEVVLFVFKSIDMGVALRDDADASPGLYPRRWTDRPVTTKFTPNRTIMVWATVLALLALALAIYTVASVYVAGEFTHGAVKEMLQGVKIDADANPVKCAADDAQCQELQKMRLNPVKCVANDGKTLTLLWHPDGVNGTLCDTAWTMAWMKQDPKLSARKDWWDDVKKWFWRPTSAHQNLSLLWPFIDCVVAIVLLILAAGLIGRGYLGGALINERNRVSLERLQQISWTVVILGGYAVLALFNAALLSSYVREKIQLAAIAEITPVLARQPVIPTDIPNLFPSMDPTLWAVLGITAVLSPYLSNRILASKSQKDTEALQQVQVKPIAAFDPLDTRPEPKWSRWSDLFMGESEANQNAIDISRLQHMVITMLLLSTYVLLLLDYMRAVSGMAVMLAMTSGVPVFAMMPPVDATFVGLLTLSHAGYLAFKAAPKGDT